MSGNALGLAALTGRSSKTQPKGRVCAHPECSTILSIYNREKTCSVHKEDELEDGHGDAVS